MSVIDKRERLLGKLQIVEAHIQTMTLDMANLEQRMTDAQSKAIAHKTSIQSIESLHGHLDVEDLPEAIKSSNHQWIDRSRQIVESLLHPLDLEIKMAHGAKLYIQSMLKKYHEEKSNLSDALAGLQDEELPVTVARTSKKKT